MILATYKTGQVVILSDEQFEKEKEYYNLKQVGYIETELSKDEMVERLIYPLTITEAWINEYQPKYMI